MTLSDTCKRFLHHCTAVASLSEHTRRAYSGDLKDIKSHFGCNKPLPGINRDHIRAYLHTLRDERKLKETTIKRRLATFKLLFKWAIAEEIINLNPFDSLNEKIRLPKRLPRALDRFDANQLKRAVVTGQSCNNFDDLCRKTAIHLLLATGIRVGELSRIHIEDYSPSDRCIKIHGKGNRQRLVYLLSPQLHRAFSTYLTKRQRLSVLSEKLFVTKNDIELDPPRIRASLRELAVTAGLSRHVTPHMLRHTCATQWLEAGLDIRYVQKLLGHHSISTTEIYTHVSDQSLREALLRITEEKKR